MNDYKQLKQDIIKVVAILSVISGFLYLGITEAMNYEIYDELYAFKPIVGEAFSILTLEIQGLGGIIIAPFVVWLYINKREKLVAKYNELYKQDIKKFNKIITKVWCIANVICGILLEIIAFILLIFEIIDNDLIFRIIVWYIAEMLVATLCLVKILRIHKEDIQQDDEDENKSKKIKGITYKIFKIVIVIVNVINCIIIIGLASFMASWNSSVEPEGKMSAREVVKYMEEKHNVDLELEKVIGDGEYLVRLKDNKDIKIRVEQFVNSGEEWSIRYDETRLNNSDIGEISSKLENILCKNDSREYEITYEEIRDDKFIEITNLMEYDEIENIVEDINGVKEYSENNPDNFEEFDYYLFRYYDTGQDIKFRIDKSNRLVHINDFEEEIIEITDDTTLEELLRYKFIGMNEEEDGTINQYAEVPKEDADEYFANKQKYKDKYGEINSQLP